MSILIRDAHVLTMDEQDTEHSRADILIEGSKIAAIGPDLEVPSGSADLRIVEADGLLAMPGLINGHLHSPGNFLKGAVDDLPLEIFMLYEIPPFADRLPPTRLTYVRTMLGAIEMLKLGITSVLDDPFYLPAPSTDCIDALMQAYADSGMRATASLDQMNVVEYERQPFLADLLTEELRAEMDKTPFLPPAELLRHYDHLIDRWHGACGGRLGAAVSCSAPQRVTPDYFASLSELSRRHDIPFIVHILESKLQRVFGEDKYGKSLVRYVSDLGLLDERMEVVHSIWVDNQDIDLLAEAGCTVAHNPVCNLKIGSGIMPFRRLRDRGVPICLGSDEASVDDSANLWTVAKVAGILHKISDPEYRKWPTAREILNCLFDGGARAMRLKGRIGALAPGYEADIALLDLNSIAFTPLNDIRRQLVFCENGSSVVMTIVAGRVVVEGGRLLTVDEEAIKAEVREFSACNREEINRSREAADRLEPYYREMYLRGANRDVGMNRWAGPGRVRG